MRKTLLLALASIAAALGCRCQPRPSPAPPIAADAGVDAGPVEEEAPAVVEAEGEPADLPVRFRCESAGRELELGADGRGTLRTRGGEPAPFTLPLVDGGEVALAHCAFLQDGLLLVLGLVGERSTWGELALLDGDPPAPRYLRYLPGLPVAAPLLAGPYLYLSADGFAGKLEVEEGRFAWSHRGLEAEEDPEPPRREGGVVAFLDASGEGLRADDETGLALPRSQADGGTAGGAPARPAPDREEAQKLLAIASAAFPGFSWLPATFLKVDLDGDGEPDYAVAGAGLETLAVVVVRGSLEKPERDLLLLHLAGPEEASLEPERLRSPPSTLVCPVAEEPAPPGSPLKAVDRPAGPNRAECEAYLRRRARLEELGERGASGLVLLPARVHLFYDPEARRLAHWGPE